MTAVANEWYRWFTLSASDVGEGEHIFFRFAMSRSHGVTIVENKVMCFVCPDNLGNVTATQLTSVQEAGGTLCRAAYGVTDGLPRVHGVGNYVLRDTAHNIALRVRKALTQEVWTDPATWAISVCIALEQGAHIHAGDQHHGVVFLVDDEYRVYTIKSDIVKRYTLWEFLSSGRVKKLDYVDNAPLTEGNHNALIKFCEWAADEGAKWSPVKYNAKNFCEALRGGAFKIPPPLSTTLVQPVDVIVDELAQKLDELANRMSHIVGQAPVKAALTAMLREVYSNKILVAKGLPAKTLEKSNMCFIGPSGTGKTTAGHLLARVLHWAGRLSTDKFSIVTGSDLIAEYVGQTGPKTRAAVEKAVGGLLFIDEAYVIAENSQFGNVCIAELLLLIQKHEHNTVFAMAGYKKDINKLMGMNQGLSPRFQSTLVFEPLSVTELAKVVEIKLSQAGLIVPTGVNLEEFVSRYSSQAKREELNGRLAERLVSHINKNHSTRIIDEALAKSDITTDLLKQDFVLDKTLLTNNTI